MRAKTATKPGRNTTGREPIARLVYILLLPAGMAVEVKSMGVEYASKVWSIGQPFGDLPYGLGIGVLPLRHHGVRFVLFLWAMTGCEASDHEALERHSASSGHQSPIVVSHPIVTLGSPVMTGLVSGLIDGRGKPIVVACSTCHADRIADSSKRNGTDLTVFHQGLTMDHGGTTCLSCHGGNRYDALRLADGTAVPFADVMVLCRQCHGPQSRDYVHGTHGGMAGYWDRTKGPRIRNNCVVCHDAHAPAYLGVQPAPGPADRFIKSTRENRND